MKKLIGVAAVGAILVALSGCANTAAPGGDGADGDLVVGFSQVGAVG